MTNIKKSDVSFLCWLNPRSPYCMNNTSRIESSIKNQELVESKRGEIVRIATKLFIDRGFSDVSVNEVADASGMSIGSLYKYIRTKEDILWLVMDSIYGQLEDLLRAERAEAADPEQALLHALERYFRAVDSVKRGILLMYREYRNLPDDAQTEFRERERRVVAIFEQIIEEGKAKGSFAPIDSQMTALNLLMMGHVWALKGWMLHDVPLEYFIHRQSALAVMLLRSAPALD